MPTEASVDEVKNLTPDLPSGSRCGTHADKTGIPGTGEGPLDLNVIIFFRAMSAVCAGWWPAAEKDIDRLQ
jgi:hypothetical protein